MRMQANEIIYADHKVILDPKLHIQMPEYLGEMAEELSLTGSAQDHIEELESMNNDGSWQVLMI